MQPPPGPDAATIRIAESLIQVLDRGGFTATYKYAVLVALLDLCLELAGESGAPPTMITTRQLAGKVIELYWPHCAPYDDGKSTRVLKQNTGKADSQAEIVREIDDFRKLARSRHAATVTLTRARMAAPPGAYEKLLDTIEWKLIEMPLWRLQRVGREEHRFLYEHSCGEHVTRKQVRRYQNGDPHAFDNRLNLKPGVGAALIGLGGVLRPLIYRNWTLMVARMNDIEPPRLGDFLFGTERSSLDPVRPGLRELQSDRCFYCEKTLSVDCHVDHFIPWSRHADNSIENLVAADSRCNSHKRDFLASAEHVRRWSERAAHHASDLREIARLASWESEPKRTFRVASAIYHMLPDDTHLWRAGNDFVKIAQGEISAALSRALAA